jgi:predicted transcriptional regulator/Na+-transporting methylmalonyl-CoA/oxaloacetate decarboxylase gamma subunit
MQSDSVGVERQRLPFTLIENIILEDQALGPVDVLVYIALVKHADGEGTCWPSMATIGKLARCTRQTVAKAIKHLEGCGYLQRTARYRPDGSVTSNVYKLIPIETKPYPVAQVDTSCNPSLHPPVNVDSTNYIQSELDPMKGELSPRSATQQPEETVLRKLPEVPELVHDRRFREGARRLLSQGKTPEELVMAIRAAVADPRECGGLSFISDRFPRWARKARDQERQEQQSRQHIAAETERRDRQRKAAEEQARIHAEQDSEEGQQIVKAAIAQLPWRRVSA